MSFPEFGAGVPRTRQTKRRTPRIATTALAPVDRVERSIFTIRGERVVLDADLAALYGVPTKVLNQAVKRKLDRFPPDFLLKLTPAEHVFLRSQFVTTNTPGRGGRRTAPFAFTEHGAIMAANLLNSPHAVRVSVLVVRAFVRLRQILAANADLARRIAALEQQFTNKTDEHEQHIAEIYKLLDALLDPPPTPKKPPIGFRPPEDARARR